MGYHITILRTKNGRSSPIGLDEVAAAISTVPDWECHPERSETFIYVQADKEVAYLQYQDGELWTTNPEQNVIAGMIALAEKLDARVRGDEYESYRSPTNVYTHPDDVVAIQCNNAVSKKRARNSKMRHYLFRAYQIAITLLFAYLAIKWCIRNL